MDIELDSQLFNLLIEDAEISKLAGPFQGLSVEEDGQLRLTVIDEDTFLLGQ